MKKRGVLILLLVLALAFAAVFGTVLGCNLVKDASAKGAVTVTFGGNGEVYTSDKASIPLKWGTVNIGANTQTVTITNEGSVNLTPHLTFTSPNLPQGWTLTFSLENQPIPAGTSATGTLTLNVPANASAGTYIWGTSITLN